MHDLFPICEECEESHRKYFCQECEQYFCEDCDAQIHRKGTRKLHNRKDVDLKIQNSQVMANFVSIKCQDLSPSEVDVSIAELDNVLPSQWNKYLNIFASKLNSEILESRFPQANIIGLEDIDQSFAEVDYIVNNYQNNTFLNFLYFTGLDKGNSDFKSKHIMIKEKLFEKFMSDNVFLNLDSLKRWIFSSPRDGLKNPKSFLDVPSTQVRDPEYQLEINPATNLSKPLINF